MPTKKCSSTWIPSLLLAFLFLTGCNYVTSRSPTPEDKTIPVTIDCALAYRSSVTVSIEQEEVLTLSASEDRKNIVVFDQLSKALGSIPAYICLRGRY